MNQSDTDAAGSNPDTRPRRIARTRLLKEVSLPSMAKGPTINNEGSKSSPATPSCFSSSSLSSPASSGLSDARSTPNTSLGASPEPVVKSLHPVLPTKRKRTASMDEPNAQIEHDAALALSLQGQAWNAESSDSDSKVKHEIEDSDSDALTDLSEASSIAEPLAQARRGQPPAKRRKLGKTDTHQDDSDDGDYESRLNKARAGKRSAVSLASSGVDVKPISRRNSNTSISSTVSNTDSSLSSAPSDEDYVEHPIDPTDVVMGDNAEEEGDNDEDEDDDEVPLAGTFAARRGQQALARTRIRDYALSRKDKERRKLEKSHPYIKTMWADLEAVPVIKPIQAPQPPSINRQLKSFQLEGLDWMIKQEKTPYKGGLLGDEMGMGKTIQAVSLIMSDYPAKQPTLVVVPPVALMQWSNEIADYTDGKLKIFVFHGQNKNTKGIKVSALLNFDVIMISYNTLESLHRKETKGWTRGDDLVKAVSPIHAIHFHRLVLDEAHSIKSRTTGVAKACFALKSNFRWCLSGTPVQNRIGEFFSLLRFLEVTPFANYLCKKCPCSGAHWNIDSKTHRCKSCKHPGFQHVSVFNQDLLNPITQPDHPSERDAAMDRLSLLTSRIMLRRMKRDHVSSMELPPKEVIIHNEFFGEVERDFSSSIMSDTTRKFDTYVSHGVMLNNYANIFGLIMQMRQVANHPDLILKKHAHEDQQNVLVCHICDEPAEDAIKSACKHEFCRTCVKTFMQSTEESGSVVDCPRCHIPLAIDLDQPEIVQDEQFVKSSSIINRINMKNWTSSTKIEMLVYDLYKLRSKKQTLKSIIFSQFTSMLQLIEWRLRRAGFTTVMLDGTMTPNQRQSSINHFMTDPSCEIFLVSLKAGGVALNLTEASRVFIVDPWWNPAAEWQSADRCHRIGQKRPCVITRLCIEDSVESRIVMLQEKKANMISGTINNDKVAMEKLTPEDMQFLFRGT